MADGSGHGFAGGGEATAFLDVERSLTGRAWRLRPADPAVVRAHRARHDLSEPVARALAARGIDEAAAPDFLRPTLKALFPDPSCFRDMDRAARLIVDAVSRGPPLRGVRRLRRGRGHQRRPPGALVPRHGGRARRLRARPAHGGLRPQRRRLRQAEGGGGRAGHHRGLRRGRARRAGGRRRPGPARGGGGPPPDAPRRGPARRRPGQPQPPRLRLRPGGALRGGRGVRAAGGAEPRGPRGAACSPAARTGSGRSPTCAAGSTSPPWARCAT